MLAIKVVGVAVGLCLVAPQPAGGHGCGHPSCFGDGCRDEHSQSSRGSRRASPAKADPSTNRKTVEGTVTEVQYFPADSPEAAMVEIQLRAGTESIRARLAPSGFLQQHRFGMKEGDALRLSGYWAAGPDRHLLIVIEAAKDGRTLRLRNDSGRPVSAGVN